MSDELEPTADPVEIEEPRTGLVVVRIGGGRRGIDVHAVREVIPNPVVTPLPMAPPLVAGMINLRGDILPVLDPAILMRAEDAAARAYAVVVAHDDVTAAILVDGVDDVAWLTAEEQQGVAALNVADILNHPQLQPVAGP